MTGSRLGSIEGFRRQSGLRLYLLNGVETAPSINFPFIKKGLGIMSDNVTYLMLCFMTFCFVLLYKYLGFNQ